MREKSLRARCFQWIGLGAARIRFNETKVVAQNGAQYWAKKRLRCSSMLVFLANAYARGTGLPLRMLREREWLRYEAAVYQQLLGQGTVLREGKRLLLPHARGELLTLLLAKERPEQKKRAMALAVRELARLHGQQIKHPVSGQLQWFSHADATVGNVLVNLESDAATWVDFETVHPASMETEQRHADDLRTLLCGVASAVSPAELPSLVEAGLAAYPDGKVLQALRVMFGYWDRRPAARLLAMPAPGAVQWECLVEAVRAERKQIADRGTPED